MNRTRRKAVSSRRSCFRNNGQRTSRMLRLLMEQLESRRVLATVTVNANSDINDGDTSSIAALINAPGVDGLISLREAILAANNTLNVDGPDADANADPDQIHFNIPGGGVQSITTNSDLPVITEAVIVDGYTQPGASPNTKQIGSDAVLMVEVFSSNTSLGLQLGGSGGSTIRGLVANRLFNAIVVASDNNVIEGNFIGIAPDGATSRANFNNGIWVKAGSNNLIGGMTPAARNVVSGVGGTGAHVRIGKLFFTDVSVASTTVRGNYIGTNAAGTSSMGTPTKYGVYVTEGIDTIIGGNDADDGLEDGVVGARNVISGNTDGIYVQPVDGAAWITDGMTIQGNFVGVDATGTTAVANEGAGISAVETLNNDRFQIGGTQPGAGNVISGNRDNGFEGGARRMAFEGNLVGTDVTGMRSLGNGVIGQEMLGTNSNGVYIGLKVASPINPTYQITVGGTSPASRNIISGSAANGIAVGTSSELATVSIQGNYIGTAIDGVTPLPNQLAGVVTNTRLIVGGTIPEAANVIAFNRGGGVNVPWFFSGVFKEFAGVSILGNSIYSNGPNPPQPFNAAGLGIDLGVAGVLLNDTNESDPDANRISAEGQNYPVITSATTTVASGPTTITGTLNSKPNASYRIEFFSSVAADPTGFGEGQTYLGFTNVVTDSTGNASFSYTPSVSVPAGRYITSTATNSNGSTSEFSQVRQIPGPPLTLSISDVTQVEGNSGSSNFAFNVTLSGNPISNVTVRASTGTGPTNSAFTVEDYSEVSNLLLTFVPGGPLTQTVLVPVFGDNSAELNETFVVNLSSPIGATLLDGQGLGTILNDDPLPTLTIQAAPVLEGNFLSDNKRISFTISLSTALSVGYGGRIATSSITATEGVDFFSGDSQTFFIPAGQTQTQVNITLIGDTIVEPDEQFLFEAIAGIPGLITNGNGRAAFTATILNDDGSPNQAPVINSNGGGDSASVNVPENSTTVTTVTAIDPDAGATLTYSINGGADAGRFTINPTSGLLAFLTPPNFESPTDSDANNSYLVTVQASDGSLSDLQTLTVTVTNVNEAPVITSNGGGDTASVNLPENTTAVTTVTATDPDAGATLTYSINGGADAGRFTINPTSGLLAFLTPPNFESPTDSDANNSYLVTVQASDGSLSDLQTLTVTVTNVNEAPVITSNGGGDTASVSIPENTTAVTTVTATDPDAGATLTYSINGGADAGRFTINPTSGLLAFLTPPNFESPTDSDANNSYLVTVQASDGSLSDLQTLTVTVTNVNEAPVITSNGGGDTASVNLPENTTAVTTVTATDPDAGATLTYSINGGADAGRFTINPTSGLLAFLTPPNFESPTDSDANNSYLVVVQASDGSLSDLQTLTVTVTNVNEAPTIISNGGGDSASVSVPENTTAVTTVNATDSDAGTTFTYSINGGADAARFTINPTSGLLAFLTPPNFEAPTDSDANNSYLVVVQASDGSLSDSQTLTVTVTNVNEAPVITSNGGGDTASVSVPENTTAVTTVTATDPDAGATLTYSINGGADAGRFTINPTSGLLAFLTPPNFESPTDSDANNSYLVTVQASDGSLSDLQTLTVTVTNVNEAPVITSNGGGDTASVSVPENTTAVTTVTATDPDAGATLTYSINGGVDAGRFTINPTSGLLAFLTPPNFQSPTDSDANNSYLVVVQASDGSLSDLQTLTVTVTNANEAPAITSNGGGDAASVSLPENTTAVTTVTATDPDAGATLTYSINGGADAGRFTINPTSGLLAFLTPPNFESPTDSDANNTYIVVVQASDGSLSDLQTLTVTVTNVNEAPVITSNGGGDTASVSLPENTTAVTTVTATDPDAGTTLTYSINGGADAGRFTINPTSGLLAFLTPPNFESPTDSDANNSYLVVVQASDGSLSDLQTLTVTVTNVNEAPVITSNGGGDTASVSLPENTTAVTTVTATDPDAGTTLTYSINGGADAGRFTINPTSGLLAFLTPPDFESPTDSDANNTYIVVVQASDGSLSDLQTLSVSVTDLSENALTIAGNVYLDTTGNGKSVDDSLWPQSSPVTLKLYQDVNGDGVYQTADTLLTSTTSGVGGAYSFSVPAVGKYIVKEVVPAGYVRTFPVLNDYAAITVTSTSTGSADWYNARTCETCINISNVSYVIDHGGVLTTVSDLRGKTREGDKVTVNFNVDRSEQFTLVSYVAPGPTFDANAASQQTVFSYDTGILGVGRHSLTVTIPKSFYQIDFVCGAFISQFGPSGSNIFYSAQNRLISADNGGVNAPGNPAIDLSLSTTVSNSAPLINDNVVITVTVTNAAGWSPAPSVSVKNVLPSGLALSAVSTSQGAFNSSTGIWSLGTPLASGSSASLMLTVTVMTAGDKLNSAEVIAAGAPDIDSSPNNDGSLSTPRNEDDDDNVLIRPQLWTKFFVVDDTYSGTTRERTFEYAADGTSVENYALASNNTAPRGAATTAAGNRVWVIDSNKWVSVYNASGVLQGSWLATGLATNATLEGIATNGVDIWIVDALQDRVFRYAGAASRLSGSQAAASSFGLNSANKNPKDIVASSTHLWVVDDGNTDQVFKYSMTGMLAGSWTIANCGGSPTGITLDPANVNHLWIVDKYTDRVYQFTGAASRISGSQSPAASFLLPRGNRNPEGIADPPPTSGSTESLDTELAHALLKDGSDSLDAHFVASDFASTVGVSRSNPSAANVSLRKAEVPQRDFEAAFLAAIEEFDSFIKKQSKAQWTKVNIQPAQRGFL